MDTPYAVPEPLWSWRRVVSATAGTTVTQGAARRHRSAGHDDYALAPTVEEYTLDAAGGWRLLDEEPGDLAIHGRLIGGCLETVANLAGTPYGPVDRFAETQRRTGCWSTWRRPRRAPSRWPDACTACAWPGGSSTRTPS